MHIKYNIRSLKSKELTINLFAKNVNFCLSLFIFALIIGLALNPAKYISITYSGLIVWASVVLPALLPFFVLTKMLTSLNSLDTLCKVFEPITKFLFKTPAISSYIFLMSIISGYPLGAKLTSECYEQGLISKNMAQKITTFTSTSGPLFIIGTVGVGMLLNQTAGLVIFASHILGSIFNGVIYRNSFKESPLKKSNILKKQTTNLNNILAESMYNSIIAVLIIGGYIAFFFMLITMLNDYNLLLPFKQFLTFLFNIFKLDTNLVNAICNGLIEITKGCLDVSTSGATLYTCTLTCSFLISFGGFSIYFQATHFLNKCNINLKFYLFQKFTHAIISLFLTLIALQFITL